MNRDATDLTYGEDLRGDYALFIDVNHFVDDWQVDDEATYAARADIEDEDDVCFFRVIENGKQRHGHGYVNHKGKVEQWG